MPVSAPTISAVDNADGSGITVTITGSGDPGQNNWVRVDFPTNGIEVSNSGDGIVFYPWAGTGLQFNTPYDCYVNVTVARGSVTSNHVTVIATNPTRITYMSVTPNLTYSGSGLQPVTGVPKPDFLPVNLGNGLNLAQGTALGLVAGTGTAVNDKQTITITGTPTGGSFYLQVDDVITAAIAVSSTGATMLANILAALNAAIGGGALFTGTQSSGAYAITFAGTLAGMNQPLMVIINATLTGGTSPTISIAKTTEGKPAAGYWKAYNDSNSDGSEVCRAILQYPTKTDIFGNHYIMGDQDTNKTTPAYLNSDFLYETLVGFDSGALTDMAGRLLNGASLASGVVIRIP